MKKLTNKTRSLLLLGASTVGTFTDGFFYIEERLTFKEAKTLLDFCKWIDEKIGGASAYNIDMLYSAYTNPNNTELQEQANQLAARIRGLRS